MKLNYYYIVARATLGLTEKMRKLRNRIGQHIIELTGDSSDEHLVFTDTFFQTTGGALTAEEILAITERLKKNLSFSKEYYYLKNFQVVLITSLDENNIIRVKSNQVRSFYYVANLRCIKKVEPIPSAKNTSFSGILMVTEDTPFQKILNDVKQKAQEDATVTDAKLVFETFYELDMSGVGMENKN